MATNNLAPKKNGRRGGRRRTAEQMDRDARALDLHCQGMKYDAIAQACGWKNRVSAYEAVRRALMDRQKTSFEAVDNFAIAVARLQRLIAENEAALARTYYVTSTTGKLVEGPNGLPLEDDAPKARIRTELRHLQDHLDKLQGNFAPTKQRVEVVTDDVVQREIDQLTKELAQVAKDNPVPSE